MNTKFLGNRFPKGLMKSLFVVSTAVVFGTSCTSQSASLSGTLDGVESDTLLVFTSHMNDRSKSHIDTVALVNNHFELQLPDTALYVKLTPKPKMPNGAIRMAMGYPILYFPGDKLVLQGNYDNYKVSGSELYDGLNKHAEIDRLDAEVKVLNEAYSKAYRDKDEAEKTRIKKEVKAKYQELLDAKFAVIKANPTTLVAAYFATQLQPKEGLEAINMLSKEIKEGVFAELLQKSKESYQNRMDREAAQALMKPGNPAPDFAFTTIDGKKVTLATFKGKYLLVDFWGTWCGWCIKGLPDMKKYYQKYHKHVEFLGVSCRDTEKKWRAGVAKHQLPWVNVLEGDSKLSVRYGVGGFPTKVLIDSEGKIVEVFVGESPELYKKLDALFGK